MCAKKVTKAPGQVETTGHSWDGIEEYNNPLPRWWVWILYACIVWGIWYSIAYPAWPMLTQATQGYLNYDNRQAVEADFLAAVADVGGADLASRIETMVSTPNPVLPTAQLPTQAGSASW